VTKSVTCSLQTYGFRSGSAVWTFRLRQEGHVYSNRVGEPEPRHGFHVPVRTSLHFTPDGVSRARAVVTINIALLTEGQPPIIDFSQAMCLPWVPF
jgi:hypothetical protein